MQYFIEFWQILDEGDKFIIDYVKQFHTIEQAAEWAVLTKQTSNVMKNLNVTIKVNQPSKQITINLYEE